MSTTRSRIVRIAAAAVLAAACLASFLPARAEEGLVSSMELMTDGVTAIDGIRIVAAQDIPNKIYTEDYGPAQVLEIMRPDMRPITIGRITTSCSCISARVEKKSFAQGERAIIEVRNVKPSQPQGATYAVFVLMTSPYRSALQHELFIKSDRKPGDPVPATQAEPAAPVAAAPAPAPAVPATSATPAPTLVTSSGTTPAVDFSGAPFRYEDITPYRAKSGGGETPAATESAPETRN